ncbi:hypothetical protein HMPREF1062_04300 [Bacteroides cellulosilyticus CL02T12C19]|uniref:Peptidase S24/S26A/S26B/S26C domain-containing protein n=2 Tax=Bacteroides TaxID=816 RepID=I9QAE9_9BACE|nr:MULTISPECIES: hypothetical protein [Bacteroides]EIY25958.1 hypothetical protein HMPREF1062_04300 [Bacteroides cellulosilyticus CL02T12C19]MCM0371198.1 hypothetical protein [Bacteroides fragilis]MCZ2653185.1 hypothetical protein [Bacteroides fragilis]
MKTNVLAFEVTSDSMDNGTRFSFAPGDKLIAQSFSISDFRNSIGNDLNSFWVIELKNGVLVRQIVEYANDTIKCHSLNTNGQYPDAFIKVEDVIKMYRVMQLQRKPIHYGE